MITSRDVTYHGQPANITGRDPETGKIHYGGQPTTCYVNPKSGEAGRVGSVEVRTTRSVMPNHLWIGIDQTEEHRA